MDASTKKALFIGGGFAAALLAFSQLVKIPSKGVKASVEGSDSKTKDSKESRITPKSQKAFVISLGGTSMQFAIVEKIRDANGNLKINILRKDTALTKTPQDLVTDAAAFLKGEEVHEVGIASFGPVGLDKTSKHYGHITSTPKEGWQFHPILKEVTQLAKQPKGFIDTDVNAAAVAEFRYGNHNVRESLAYITVGTGVGVGVVIGGKPVHGLVHPEGGHILIRIAKEDQDFEGVCPFHKNCLEGLCTNKSIAKRLGVDVHHLPSVEQNHDVWGRVAYYLAQLCLNITLLLSPEAIIIGGGIVKQKTIMPTIRKEFTLLLNDYVQHQRLKDVDNYIKTPTLGDEVEIYGGALLSE